jgi:hypothetical protein
VKLRFHAIFRLGPYLRSDLSIAHTLRAGKQFSYSFSHVVSFASHPLFFEWVLVTHKNEKMAENLWLEIVFLIFNTFNMFHPWHCRKFPDLFILAFLFPF